ncbi:MAG: redox-sensitive bicupin YhaK (pirin superfamily) [Motiliproteus sp.]|jgi:redox-sensitive bicupin YhaK (pirin superfamily)
MTGEGDVFSAHEDRTMITLRLGHERGHGNHGWLDSRHSFSFANYYDPRHMGVSALRVINDDRVKPGAGFETHAHRDMEIISYILEGSIEHQDTQGIHTLLKAGEVQVMSAGTGIEHSEFNASASEDLHFLQIWIQPNEKGVMPRYAQQDYSEAQGLTLIVSPDGRNGSMPIRQQASLYKLSLANQATTFTPSKARTYYLHIARGALEVNGIRLQAGDGATIDHEPLLNIQAADQAEGLLFELP